MSFDKEGNKFVTVGGDNTLRQFDMRDLSKSHILFDQKDDDPFIRVAWNKKDCNQIALISLHSSKIFIFDVRSTDRPLYELKYHKDRVNNIVWNPDTNGGKYFFVAVYIK